jgi:hypothetical protein
LFVLGASSSWWFVRCRKKSSTRPTPKAGPWANALVAIEALPAPHAFALERVIESLRSDDPAPLPDTLLKPYQRIRFGSPTVAEIEQFTHSLKEYLRARSAQDREGAAR